MKRTTIQVGSFEVCCSILSENDKAWIVDPGQDSPRIIRTLKKLNLTPTAILLTHAHFDHIGAIPALLTEFPNLPVFVHPQDKTILGHPLNCLPPDYPLVESSFAIQDATKITQLDNLFDVETIVTPGHTPGSVCYYFSKENLLLSGDTLFAGSVGRTDLPGGDMATLIDSLSKIMRLPDETVVIPGHGPQTTIGREKRSNPFLR